MATSWNAAEVRCPFYVDSSSRSIRCEGVCPDSWTTLTFTGAQVRLRQMERFCMGDFCGCGLYRELERKYES